VLRVGRCVPCVAHRVPRAACRVLRARVSRAACRVRACCGPRAVYRVLRAACRARAYGATRGPYSHILTAVCEFPYGVLWCVCVYTALWCLCLVLAFFWAELHVRLCISCARSHFLPLCVCACRHQLYYE